MPSTSFNRFSNRCTSILSLTLPALITLLVSLSGAGQITAAEVRPLAPAGNQAVITTTTSAKATFAGGCFWCMEAVYQKLEGVSDVVSGFTGGTSTNPTYKGDHSGHYEAIEVTYDPSIISYTQLLEKFWVNVDPFDAGGQFCDRGPSYLSAIFVANDEQKIAAEQSRAAITENFANSSQNQTAAATAKIVTPVLAASPFYPVEEYHQDYFLKKPLRYKFYRSRCGRDARLTELWSDR